MTNNNQTAVTNKPVFKQFPQFTRLTFKNKNQYEALVEAFPSISDVSFVTLKLWWDDLDNAQVALLNDNLVIAYWMHGDEELSGLSLIGTSNTDQSICTIFDYLRTKDRQVRLINVPEFVMRNIDHPELFRFDASLRDDEYIIEVSRLADIKKMPVYQRSKIKHFMKNTSKYQINTVELDLANPENRLKLINKFSSWPKKGFNAVGALETEIMLLAIKQSKDLGIKNLCLIVDGELQAFVLYNVMHDLKHVVAQHARINYGIRGLFEYVAHAFGLEMQKQGVEFMNLHSDVGLIRLRALKLALQPTGFNRKFTIEPI